MKAPDLKKPSEEAPRTSKGPENTLTKICPYLLDVKFSHGSDGYTMRNLIDYLKNTNTTGSFLFRPDSVTYTEKNADHTLLNSVVIWPNKLTRESRDSSDSDNDIKKQRSSEINYYYGTSEPFVQASLKLADLRRFTRFINRKNGMRLYMRTEENGLYLHIQPIIKNKRDTEPVTDDKLKLLNDIEAYDALETDEYIRKEDNPNCEIEVEDFCKMCNKMQSLETKHIVVKGYTRGVQFECQSAGIAATSSNFGICDANVIDIKKTSGNKKLIIRSTKAEETPQFKIKKDIFKALSKINNLTPADGMVRIYIEPNAAMRITCQIGCFGKLTIYLEDFEVAAAQHA